MFSNRLGWIGVDIGTHTVKLAQAVRTPEGVRLRHAAVIQRPDPWSDDDALGLAVPDSSRTEIRAALECGQFRGRSAACLLPMNVCELRGLNVPLGDPQERRAMIAIELADDWAERAAAVEFDYWELGADRAGEAPDGFNVDVLSVARPWIAQVAGDLQQARLDCWAIDGGPLAIARAVTQAATLRGTDRVLAVDWGFSNTTLCVVGNQRPLYARRVHQCSFRVCLEAVQNALGVTLDHAQYLVDTHGVVDPSGERDEHRHIQQAVTEAIADPVNELVAQLRRTLRFVELQRRHLRPTSVWLLGGGASVRNMGAHLSAALELPVRIWQVPSDTHPEGLAAGGQAALFGGAFALSTLAWRAA